jgi:hypothetical protein
MENDGIQKQPATGREAGPHPPFFISGGKANEANEATTVSGQELKPQCHFGRPVPAHIFVTSFHNLNTEQIMFSDLILVVAVGCLYPIW